MVLDFGPLNPYNPMMQRWVRALWIWWLLCGMMMGGLWLLATRSGLGELHREREQRLSLSLLRIQEKLSSLQVLPARALSDPRLTPERLQPFFHLYDLNSSSCPAWVEAMVSPPRAGISQLRPLPPGLGSLEATVPPEAPGSYWLLARADGKVASLDVDYLFGPWLDKQLEEWGGDVKVEHLSSEQTWRKPEGLVLTLFASDPYPFDGMLVRLDHSRAVRAYLMVQSLWLLLGSLLLVGFAAALRLAASGMRSQWNLVEARRQFNAMVSHELRTPVSALRMYSEILQNDWVDDPEKVRGYHQIIATESARLQHLVENLLGVGALESGRSRFESLPVQLNELLTGLVARHNWSVEMELEASLPEVRGDREALSLIFGNLIENGFRHGGGRVALRTCATPGEVVVEVMDWGVGIAAEDRMRVFEAYQRLESQARGVGLGLALVRGFVEAQSGRVEILDREGGGAVFRVSFPR